MPSIGGTELVIILVFAFLLFGPDKLPQMGRTIGRALRQFRETQEKLTNVVQTEVVDPMAAAANKPKPKTQQQAEAEDEDADIESGSTSAAAPHHKETFAERRARLAAEKAEREAAATKEEGDAGEQTAASEPALAADAADAKVSEQPAAPAQAESAEAKGEGDADEKEEPVVETTEDLYARRPRKHRRAQESAGTDTAEEGGEQ